MVLKLMDAEPIGRMIERFDGGARADGAERAHGGPRDEGVPAKNLFPNSNDGFRRPGFAVTAGPGGQYTYHHEILTAGVYKAVHRDRTSSYPDSVYGTHGDAAFAQYVWLASWTHRF